MTIHNTTPRTESAALSLSDVSVCLHYVETCTGTTATHSYPHGSVMQSMELDLLAYRFQDPPPFGSKTETVPAAPRLQRQPHNRWPIVIEFPTEFVYHSEGRAPRLVCPQPQRKAEILVSSTRFLACGTRIWHLVITPRPGETFSEYDLIKLIHLYDGRTERTGLRDNIRFRLGDTSTTRVNATDLPGLLGLPIQQATTLELKCGTLELLIGDRCASDDEAAENPGVAVFDTLRHAREPDGAAASRQLKSWMNKDCEQRRIIMAYCGIVTGIFDFDKIDNEEALDTLEPTFASSSAFLRIHRRSLICITEDDRSLRECWNSVGISPYLILPHAMLLYNETLVDTAEQVLDTALTDAKAKLTTLESAYIDADRHLNTLYLPNVFNYVTERSLFEAGSECRGSNAKRNAVLAKLDQLKEHIDIVRERERNRGQVVIQILLAIISVLQLKGIIAEMFDWEQQNPGVWMAVGLSILALTGAVWWSYNKGLPRRVVNNKSNTA